VSSWFGRCDHDARFGSVLERELRPQEMDQLSMSESTPSGLFGQTPCGHGDEATDGVRGNRRVARGAELRRSPPCPPRHSRCHPPPR